MSATEPGTEATALSKVVVVGMPFNANSSFLRGPALAPARIRAALHSGSMNLCVEDGRDLDSPEARDDWRDVGDLTPHSSATAFADIEREMAGLIASGARVLSLGGDHSITYPILRAVGPAYPSLYSAHRRASRPL